MQANVEHFPVVTTTTTSLVPMVVGLDRISGYGMMEGYLPNYSTDTSLYRSFSSSGDTSPSFTGHDGSSLNYSSSVGGGGLVSFTEMMIDGESFVPVPADDSYLDQRLLDVGSSTPPSPTVVRKRRLAANARERKRMNSLNVAFDKLHGPDAYINAAQRDAREGTEADAYSLFVDDSDETGATSPEERREDSGHGRSGSDSNNNGNSQDQNVVYEIQRYYEVDFM
ncbi:hypothetical protein quinque_009374 [Culex quinquefasciatus]